MEEENEHHVPLERTKKNIQQLINITRKYAKNIVFIGLTPVDEEKVTPIPWNANKFYRNKFIDQYDRAIREIAETNDLLVLDMLSAFKGLDYKNLMLDGLHPNTDGYEEMAKLIKEFLIEHNVISLIN